MLFLEKDCKINKKRPPLFKSLFSHISYQMNAKILVLKCAVIADKKSYRALDVIG